MTDAGARGSRKIFSALQPRTHPKRRTRSILAVFVLTLIMGPASLAIWPLPTPLVLAYLTVGVCTGVLALADEDFFKWAGLAVYLMGLAGVTGYAEDRWQDLGMLVWQSAPLTLCATVATVAFGPVITRLIATRTRRSDRPGASS